MKRNRRAECIIPAFLFLTVKILSGRALQRHRGLMWDNMFKELSVSSAPVDAGQSTERLWYTLFTDHPPNPPGVKDV